MFFQAAPVPRQLAAGMGQKPPNWRDLLQFSPWPLAAWLHLPVPPFPLFKRKILMASPSWGCGRLSDGVVYGEVDRQPTLNT